MTDPAAHDPVQDALARYDRFLASRRTSPQDRLRRAALQGDVEQVIAMHRQQITFKDMLTRSGDGVIAISGGHLPMLQWILKTYPHEPERHPRILSDAARTANREALIWLEGQGFDIRAARHDMLAQAIMHNRHDVADWLWARGASLCDPHTNFRTIASAARKGHLSMLQRPEIRRDLPFALWADEAMYNAAEHGHLPVVQYLHEQGCNISKHDDHCLRMAACNGHLPVVRYLCENGADIHVYKDNPIDRATAEMHADVVKYLHERGAPLSARAEELLNGYNKWTGSVHKECPNGLHIYSPHYFRPQAFAVANALLVREGYDTGTMALMARNTAYHAAGLFKTPERLLHYFEKWGEAGRQPFHDLVQGITLPQQGRYNIAAWGDAVLRHGPEMARYVTFADKMPEPLKDNKGQWSLTRTRDALAKEAYQNGAQHPQLATWAFTAGWNNNNFNDALRTIEAYDTLYNRGGAPKDRGRIPAIAIDGAAFGKDGYHFYKLPDGDVRGLLLGAFTACCQHLGGAGKACAQHGFSSPHGGFYVVADKKTDQIVAQSWVWRGRKDELVMDSLESLSGHMQSSQWKRLCDHFAAAAMADERARITAIHCGTGGATPADLGYNRAPQCAQPYDYGGYRDSERQYRILPPA